MWLASVARLRGVDLKPERIEQIVALVGPTLDAFAEIADGLAVDEDMHEFRRLLASEAEHA